MSFTLESHAQPGGRERLPQIGFNTMDGRQLPFPENLPINRETLLQFTSAFLSGRLQRSQDTQKAMVSAAPYSKHNTVRRKAKRKSPPEVPGVSEELKPQDAILQVRRKQSFFLAQYQSVAGRFIGLDDEDPRVILTRI